MRFDGTEEEFGKMPEDGGNFFITGADVLDQQDQKTHDVEEIAEEKEYGSEERVPQELSGIQEAVPDV